MPDMQNPQTQNPQTAGTGRATGDTSTRDIQKLGSRSDDSPRGAGSGENAIIEREKQFISYDPATRPIKERRQYLMQQAEKNQEANDQINAAEVKFLHRYDAKTPAPTEDPDKLRDKYVKAAIAEIDMHEHDRDPTVMQAQRDFRDDHFGVKTGMIPPHPPHPPAPPPEPEPPEEAAARKEKKP
jgi:hypothetical protein